MLHLRRDELLFPALAAAAVRQRQGRSDFRFGNFTINQDVQLSTNVSQLMDQIQIQN